MTAPYCLVAGSLDPLRKYLHFTFPTVAVSPIEVLSTFQAPSTFLVLASRQNLGGVMHSVYVEGGETLLGFDLGGE